MTDTAMKSATNGKRAQLVLSTVRVLFADRNLDGAACRAVGLDRKDGEFLTIEDPRLVPLVLEAGKAPGFGEQQPADGEIKNYLDARFGVNVWRYTRRPHRWERGGGDAKLEKLLDEEDSAIADRERLESEMWHFWDERKRVFSTVDGRNPAAIPILKAAEKDLAAATKVWEKAREREGLARGQVCNWQCYLQENFLREQTRLSPQRVS